MGLCRLTRDRKVIFHWFLSQLFAVFLLLPPTPLLGQEPKIFDLHLHSIDPVSFFRSFGMEPTDESTLGYVCKNKEELLTKTLEEMDAKGVECALLQGTDNSIALDWAARYPGRFLPAFHPAVWSIAFQKLDHVAEAQKLGEDFDNKKFYAIGELVHVYDRRPINWSMLDPYFKVAEEKHVPVLFHTGDTFGGEDGPNDKGIEGFMNVYASPLLLADVAQQFPKLKIVACHSGMHSLRELLLVMRQFKNVGADISYLNWKENDPRLLEAIKAFRKADMMDRVYYGSDQMVFTDLIPASIENTRAVLNSAEQEKVLRANARRLLNLNE